MKLYILIVSEYSGPAFAYNDKPEIFTDEKKAIKRRDEIDSDSDKSVYMYSEEFDCNPGDLIYVISIGYYHEEGEYLNKMVKFFKTQGEAYDYIKSIKNTEDFEFLYTSEYFVK